MPTVLQNTTDSYGDFQIGPFDEPVSLVFAVSAPNAASYQIAKRFGTYSHGEWEIADQVINGGGQGGYVGAFGIRFKSFVVGASTAILVVVGFRGDPVPNGFVPGNVVFNTSGVTG